VSWEALLGSLGDGRPSLISGEIDADGRRLLTSYGAGFGVSVAPAAHRMRRAGYLADLAWARFQRGDVDDPLTLVPIYLHQPGGAPPMSQPQVTLLRPMRREDIPQVAAIDQQSFPMSWSPNAYLYEIEHNPLSWLAVVVRTGTGPAQLSWIDGLRQALKLNGAPGGEEIIGYGGFWFTRREAHISTLAVRPDWRGQGLGEVLLAGMVRRALGLEAELVSLEVRVSNTPALALYRKYAFAESGVKRAYYRDNGEDAYDMRVQPLDAIYRERFDALWEAVTARVSFVDAYTETAIPHRAF
jgi:ribosomal-protein-alanine N-acetyltransferase